MRNTGEFRDTGNVMRKVIFQSVTQAARKEKSEYSQQKSNELLVTSPYALPLSYRRLVEARDTKLGSNKN